MSLIHKFVDWRHYQTTSLSDISKLGQHDEALRIQTSALNWFDQLSTLQPESQPLSLTVNGVLIDCVAALRSELKIHGAQTLRAIESANLVIASSNRLPILKPSLDFKNMSRFAHILNNIRPSVEGEVYSRTLEALHISRQSLYLSKLFIRQQLTKNDTKVFRNLRTENGNILMIPKEPTHVVDLSVIENELLKREGIQVEYMVVTDKMQDLLKGHDRTLHEMTEPILFPWSAYKKMKKFILTRGVELPRFSTIENLALSRCILDTLRSNLIHILRFAHHLIKVIERRKPKVIMVGNPMTMEGKVATIIAKAFETPVAALEHGTIRGDDPIWKNCLLDKFLVWGEPSKQSLLKAGFRETQIQIVGAPRMDTLLQSFKSNYSTEKKFVLVATSGPGNQVSEPDHIKFTKVLRKSVLESPHLNWVVKLHRKDKNAYYLQNGTLPPNMRLIEADYKQQGVDIFTYLRDAFALLTISSTAALDAMLVNIPVITFTLKPEQSESGIEFIDSGSTFRVSNSFELVKTTNQLYQADSAESVQSTANEYIQRHYYYRGKAGREAAKAIVHLARSK